jgi:hypothetical protein
MSPLFPMTTPMYLPEMVSQLRYICYFKETQFTLLNVINYQDFLYGISLPDIHRDLVFINDVLICQTLCPITLILQLPQYHRGLESN